MEGWIKLHRKMINWEWYQDKNVKELFIHLLLTVNHKDKKWQGIEVKRGQRITSLEHLSNEINLSIMQIRTALNKLKLTNEITVKTTNKYTVITIVKYSNYQCQDVIDNKQNNIQDNNQITNEQQTNNKQITTNKNDKNIKNEKNEKEKKNINKKTEIDDLINKNFTDEELKNTIYEFIKMRKAIKKPLTTRGLELMIKKLYTLTTNIDEQIQILNNSIMNNWQGIFPLKKETNKNNKKGSFDDFKQIWEEAKKQDEQTGNGANNNFFGW